MRTKNSIVFYLFIYLFIYLIIYLFIFCLCFILLFRTIDKGGSLRKAYMG